MRLFQANTRSTAARLLVFAAVLGGAWFSSGCERPAAAPAAVREQRQLSGQVFIVLPDGGSLRLGSVEVRIFDETTVNRFLQDSGRQLEERHREKKARLAEFQEEVARVRNLQVDAEVALQRREGEVRTALRELRTGTAARVEELNRTLESNRHFINNMDQMPEAPRGIPTLEEFRAFEEGKNKWLSMSRTERRSWAAALQRINDQITEEIRELESRYDQTLATWSDELAQLDERVEELRREIAVAVTEAGDFRDAMAAFPTHDDFFALLPEPMARIRTDADGEYAVAVPKGGRHAVFSRANRMVDGETIEFTWFVWTEAESRPAAKILLSNHNVVTESFPENVLVLPKRGVDPEANT